MGLMIWIISMVVFFFILYYVIMSAIDNSEMAKTLRKMKAQMEQSAPPDHIASYRAPSKVDREGNDNETCPGCGNEVGRQEIECPHCLLRLRGEP